jgi:tetratricopeptide (TPR) repeat protein
MAAPASAEHSKLSIAVNRAVTAYREGRLAEAEQICEKAVAKKRNFFDAIHVLAVVQSALGKHDLALENYNRAVSLHPQHATNLSNRGDTLVNLGRFDEALASYERALAIEVSAVTLHNRGIALHHLRRLEAALASFDQALALDPHYAQAYISRGTVLHDLFRFEESLASHDRSLSLRTLPNALTARAHTLRALGRYEEALESCDRALRLRPNFIDVLDRRGSILREMKHLDESLSCFDRLILLDPHHAFAHNNRGNTLRDMDRLDEALASYERALSLQPTLVEAMTNRGVVLNILGRFDLAMAAFQQALSLTPNLPEPHWNQAITWLLHGDFQRGLPEYEWRLKKLEVLSVVRNFPQPRWNGEDLTNKTILLHCEQGLGDTVQFARYVPLVAARGGQIILEVQKPLQRLVTTLGGASQIIARGDPLPAFDLQCPLLSLPMVFGTRVDTIPSRVPYLQAPPDACAMWQARLGKNLRPRIGLTWAGNPKNTRDRERSMSFRELAPLLDVDATFVSLQKDVSLADEAELKDTPNILRVSDDLLDFTDTASLVANLDLVISVDTSVAHLAGALGKPVWIMVTHLPDWRWMLDREDSPWYSSARIFRQDATRKWSSLVGRVREALADAVRAHGNAREVSDSTERALATV